ARGQEGVRIAHDEKPRDASKSIEFTRTDPIAVVYHRRVGVEDRPAASQPIRIDREHDPTRVGGHAAYLAQGVVDGDIERSRQRYRILIDIALLEDLLERAARELIAAPAGEAAVKEPGRELVHVAATPEHFASVTSLLSALAAIQVLSGTVLGTVEYAHPKALHAKGFAHHGPFGQRGVCAGPTYRLKPGWGLAREDAGDTTAPL